MTSPKRFLLRTFSPVIKYQVIGKSMEPTFQEGSMLLACRIAYHLSDPKPGHAVAMRDPRTKQVLLKRINRKENGKFFVTGDNQTESTDSRQFGWIKRRDILAKVFYKL